MVFSDEIQKNVSEIVRDLRTKYKSYTLVGFHVRKGDITQNGNIALGYKSAGPGYINRSLEYFHSRFPDSVFVVSSDSIQWCRDNFPERYKLHFLEGNWSPVDLLVLASLDHIVTSFGTYSWWAGYWNRGITLYMDDFVVPGSPIGDQYNKTDYIYPGWVGL
nr:hypothetical protein BaRGS_027394 [Batillaria attramentaria]